jgi:hypothetical protein
MGTSSIASYDSLSTLVLVGILRVFLGPTSPTRNVLAAAATSLIFPTRTTIAPAVLFFAVVALARARTWKHRLLVMVATVSVPSIFFLADHRHLNFWPTYRFSTASPPRSAITRNCFSLRSPSTRRQPGWWRNPVSGVPIRWSAR